MQQLVYAMHFKGTAAPLENPAQGMTVTARAVSCSITSVVNKGGLTGGFDPAAVTNAVFESEVALITAGTFTEQGTITFGEQGHKLRFVSVSAGWMGQSPNPTLKQGTVVWTVEGGEGQFDGAGGLITSNFTVGESGEVDDYQMGVIYLR